jgi:hypothetical protein
MDAAWTRSIKSSVVPSDWSVVLSVKVAAGMSTVLSAATWSTSHKASLSAINCAFRLATAEGVFT